MPTREELEATPTKELHTLALAVAKHRLDVGFVWDLVKALPVAEEVVGDDDRSKIDIVRPTAMLNDLLYDSGEGELGEVLRPMYIDYLLEHAHAADKAAKIEAEFGSQPASGERDDPADG
jgi:hypothetical protein